MEPNTLFKIVGAVVLGLLGYVVFGFVAGIVGAAIGVYLGPIAIKKFLDAR
jgi:uncharacterized membrane protein